jgi:hypothetical protein
MTPEQRKAANKDQINGFFSSYYSEWRYIQIMSISKNLNSKYEFYADIIEEIKETDLNASERTIAQEISNGLLFEAIQHSIQYIEDLFALLNAGKNLDYFIRSIVKYDAGKIERLIKNFPSNKKMVCDFFISHIF